MAANSKRIPFATVASLGAHVLIVGALLLVAARHRPVVMRPLHLPGTLQGQQRLLTYTTGAPAEAAPACLPRPRPTPSPRPQSATLRAPSLPVTTLAPAGQHGSGTSGDSALGDENVRVALPQNHPRPLPDLSSLPHGLGGDVIVDVAIDDTGKVVSTTLVRGLGGAIDATVMQVLRDWTFTPATRNGQNVASEQEIIVHYEHG